MAGRALVIFGLGVVAILGSCSAPTIRSKSRFLAAFSASDVVRVSYNQTDPEGPPVDTVQTSSSLGHHRNDYANLVINASDGGAFLLRIKGEIERRVVSSGGKVVGEGSGNDGYSDGYSIEYTDGGVHGWIDVLGMRGPGDSYRLVIITREN